MARYLLAVNFQAGVVDTPMEEWKPEEIRDGALEHYRAAASRTTSHPEQRYLASRAARIKTSTD